jgi:hypothetical protein
VVYFIQAEYEVVTKPYLVKGLNAVYFLGIILFILSAFIAVLLYSVVKKL